MSQAEVIALLRRAHYHLMDRPRYWYELGSMNASRIMCVIASDMNVELLKAQAQ